MTFLARLTSSATITDMENINTRDRHDKDDDDDNDNTLIMFDS